MVWGNGYCSRYRELLEIKRRLDPGGLFISDLARRVGIESALSDSPFDDRTRQAAGR